MGDNITLAGYSGGEEEPNPDHNWITPGFFSTFFSTIKVPLLAGREFSEQDTATSQIVVTTLFTLLANYCVAASETVHSPARRRISA
jgi:hypothetical protein